MVKPTTWKKPKGKLTFADKIEGLIDDMSIYLKRNKNIQNLQNFKKRLNLNISNLFKRKTIPFTVQIDKDKEIGIKVKATLKKVEVFDWAKEIFADELKQKTPLVTKEEAKKFLAKMEKNLEPSVQDVKEFLVKADKKNYPEIIANGIVDFFLGLAAMFLYILEGGKFIIEYVFKLPFKQLFTVLFKFGIIVVSIGMIIFITNFFRSITVSQQLSNEKIEALDKKSKLEYKSFDDRLKNLQQEFTEFKASSIRVEHKVVEKEYRGINGQIKSKVKIY